MTVVLSTIALVFNASATVLFVLFAHRHKKWFNPATYCLLAGTTVLFVYLGIEGSRLSSCPSLVPSLTYAFFALMIYLIYFVMQFKLRIRLLATFVVPVAFTFQALALLLQWPEPREQRGLGNTVVGMHSGLAIIGHSLFTLAFAAALMYLIQQNNLKSKRFNQWYHRLPALDKLNEIVSFCILSGFPIITTGIVIGVCWALQVWQGAWYLGADIVAAASGWMIFLWLFYSKLRRKSKGSKYMVMVIWGFFLILISYALASLFGSIHGLRSLSGA